MKDKILLWLDDERNPFQADWILQFASEFNDYKENIVWVKNYEEFTDWINKNGLPYKIAFDHDLGTANEKTGKNAADFLVKYCMDNDKDLPYWTVQSSNPAGKKI